jgi:hypothetical protein
MGRSCQQILSNPSKPARRSRNWMEIRVAEPFGGPTVQLGYCGPAVSTNGAPALGDSLTPTMECSRRKESSLVGD